LTTTELGRSLFSFSSQRPGVTLGSGSIKILELNEKMPTKPINAIKFRVNEKCPCGLQKKYKKCCFPKYDYAL
jgi:hypothetical protein